jgi:hypothetical protein
MVMTVMTASSAPSIMMTSAAATHMTVAMAMSALHQHDGVAAVGGNRACGNARHREYGRRRGCKRNRDQTCFDKSFHWDLLRRVARQLA